MADDFEVSVDFDLSALRDMLVKDPAFIAAVALLVRNEMTRTIARQNGNIFERSAQVVTPAPGKLRLT